MILKMLFWIYITVIHNQLKQNICKLHLLKLFWRKPVSIGGKLSKIWRGTKWKEIQREHMLRKKISKTSHISLFIYFL